ncbi:hypothetical protein [Marinicrinis lubricantis]|uniref:Small, acid-soluble spore protein gamma-type n=1 Tax=Marinicrinis lubricantis TaxID=2086470 RepID=A0ABW1IR66_9BACL
MKQQTNGDSIAQRKQEQANRATNESKQMGNVVDKQLNGPNRPST